MPSAHLATVSSWALLALGAAHVVVGAVKYRRPLADAVAAGFVNGFAAPDLRRTAFWFVMFGLPLLLAGHLAVRAAGAADLATLRLIGGHVFATALIGTAAFPRSPFPVALVVALLLCLAGHGA